MSKVYQVIALKLMNTGDLRNGNLPSNSSLSQSLSFPGVEDCVPDFVPARQALPLSCIFCSSEP